MSIRHEAPVPRPGLVVDLGERVEVAAQAAPAHLADRDPVLRLELVGQLPDDRHHVLAARDVERPHEQVHRLVEPRLLAQPLVVGRLPGLADHRLALEALDQHAALVVHGEVHRADHAVAPALAQPLGGGVEQRGERLGVLLHLEEAEHPPGVVVELVEGGVDLRAHAADGTAVAPGQEELALAVLEERVQPAGQEHVPLELEGRDPGRPDSMQPERQIDELAPVRKRPDRSDLD